MDMPDSISMLDSHKYWNTPVSKRALLRKMNADKAEPVPSMTSHQWLNMFNGYCPFCEGMGWFDGWLNFEEVPVWCYCKYLEHLEWNHAQQQEFGPPVSPSGRLLTLDPALVKDVDGRKSLTEALNYVIDWLPELNKWLFIYGGLGCGKTTILAGIKSVLKDMAFYITMTDWQDQLFGYLNRTSDEDDPLARMTDALHAAPVLLLDDLGTENTRSPYIAKQIESVINWRYANAAQLPVVVTSNYTPKELMGSLDLNIRRTADRILDGQYTQILHLTAPSYRQATQVG